MKETKCLKNLYNIINEYFKKLKKEYQKEQNTNQYDKLETSHQPTKQQLLNYEVSIYKYIENKKPFFIEILDTNNSTPYTLTPLESEILRHYIGLYNEGKRQSKKEISERFGISIEKINDVIHEIMLCFNTEIFQTTIIEERNQIINKNIESLEQSLLEKDITFLNITEDFIDILRKEKINTIKDILNINYTQIKKMNIEYGYSPKIIIFPKRIIEEIHSLGLEFKNESMIESLFKSINCKPIDINLGEKIKTISDLICARQFEPQILNTLNIVQLLNVDIITNRGYMKEIYDNMVDDIIWQDEITEREKQLEFDYTKGKTYYIDKN